MAEQISVFRILYTVDLADAQREMMSMQQRIIDQETTILRLSRAAAGVRDPMQKMADSQKNVGYEVEKVTKITKDNNKEIDKSVTHFNRQNASMLKMIGSAIKWAVVFTVIYGVLRQIMSAIQGMITAVVELDQALGDIGVTLVDAGVNIDDTLVVFRDAIQTYAEDSRESIVDIAKSLFILKQAGLSTSQALVGFSGIMDLVTGGLGNTTEIAELTAGIFNTMGNSIKGATTDEEKLKVITDALAYVFTKEQVTIQQLKDGLSYLAPSAGIVSDSFQDLTVMIGFLNTEMLKGSKAGRLTSTSMMDILSDTKKLAEQLGITFDPDKPLSYLDTIKQIRDTLGIVSDKKIPIKSSSILEDLFGKRSSRPVLLLVQHFDLLREKIQLSKDGMIDFAFIIKSIRMDTIESRSKELQNSWKNFVVSFSEAFKPSKEYAQNLRDMSNSLDRNKDKALELGLALRYAFDLKNLKPKIGKPQNPLDFFDMGKGAFGMADFLDFIIKGKEKAKKEVELKKEEVKILAEAEKIEEELKKIETERTSTIEKRLGYELKLIDLIVNQELSVREKLGETEEDIARANLEAVKAKIGLLNPEEQIMELARARFNIENAILDTYNKQKSAVSGNLDVLSRLLKEREGFSFNKESTDELIQYTLGKKSYKELTPETQKQFSQYFPKEAQVQETTKKLTEAGFLVEPEVAKGRVGEGMGRVVSKAEGIAREIANIVIHQRNLNEIEIGGVKIIVTPAMTVEDIGKMAQKAIEQAYRDNQSVIKRLSNKGIEDYK